jgi:hypothetical protein
MNKRLLPALFFVMFWVAGCGSSGWLKEDVAIQNMSIWLEAPAEQAFILDSRRISGDVRSELMDNVADSLSRSALGRILHAYSARDSASLDMAERREDADLIFRIDEIEVSGIRTLNVVHPGPVFRISAKVSGWQGDTKVFEKQTSKTSNLAVMAAEGRSFHFPTDDERADPELQRLTIYPTMRSVFGAIWQEMVDEGRKLR